MSATKLKQYRKTVAAVKEPPWCLNKAHKYLETLCNNNECGQIEKPPALKWTLAGARQFDKTKDLLDEWKKYAPGPATEITVSRNKLQRPQSLWANVHNLYPYLKVMTLYLRLLMLWVVLLGGGCDSGPRRRAKMGCNIEYEIGIEIEI